MNGGKDFCEWSKRDRELASTIGKAVELVLGKYGKGLVNLALAESFLEKGGDNYEVAALANKGRMQAESVGRIEQCFVADGILAWLHILTGKEAEAEELLTRFYRKAEAEGKMTARVHTGDPAVFGAHREQMDELSRLGIDYDVIPGVSSFLATAAALKKEYTLPGVSQTVILTRMEGRTPMPPKEKLRDLAKHNSTMIIFLSVGMIEQLADTLKEEYREDTPVAVVYKASWEDQKIVIGNLTNIAQKVKEAGITKTALTVVGDFLGDEYELSKLYDKTFTHEFRQAKE